MKLLVQLRDKRYGYIGHKTFNWEKAKRVLNVGTKMPS